MLLGKHTPVVDNYQPALLYPIPRATGRAWIAGEGELPFYGFDLWHAYEISWLDKNGRPAVRVGRVVVPANSPNLVESKSFKLYLNSLNSTRFDDEAQLIETMRGDLSKLVGAEVELEFLGVADRSLQGAELMGPCLDLLDTESRAGEPDPEMLLVSPGDIVEEHLHSHLLRSLCPVTGQPDWASVWVHYRGARLDHSSLLRYIIAYRRHQEFHEQCVERIFCDLQARIAPEFLHTQAFYTRRGGLDINPFRSTDPTARPLPRLNRQ